MLVKELQALCLKVDLLKFADEVPVEAPVVQTQEGAAELVRLKTRFDEEVETEDLIPATDQISDLTLEEEDPDAIKAGIEEGDLGEATGVTAKQEVREGLEDLEEGNA